MSARYLVTIGTFDGVHRGHQKLLKWVRARARKLGLKVRVAFFVSPPRFYFQPRAAMPLLTARGDRTAILRGLGCDRVDALRFGPRLARMPHTRFFEEYVVRRWRAGGLLVGRDFAFGRGRRGDLAYLKQACARKGLAFGVLPLVRVAGRKISSSDIRELLMKGRAREAARLLGRPHFVRGRVVRGRGLGSRLGFPTANIRVSPEVLLPPGVFHVRVEGAGPRPRDGAANVGTRPTLPGRGARRPLLEVHLPGFSGGLYGRELKVEFLRRLRPERRFKSLESLRAAIRRDVAAVRRP